MKFLLFEHSAVEKLVSTTEFQSIEYPLGEELISHVIGKGNSKFLHEIYIQHTEEGVMFVGKRCQMEFLLFDLTQCNLLSEKDSPESLLLVLQKTFRTSIRTWDMQPFTSSERIHGSKSIIFPFTFTDRRRVVIERAAKCERLEKRRITRPILAYKYSAEDAPRNEEIPDISVLRDAGELYIEKWFEIKHKFQEKEKQSIFKPDINSSIEYAETSEQVCGRGFKYLTFEKQVEKLTNAQKKVVESNNIRTPLRVDGPAGTGKTASLILRAYYLLRKFRREDKPFHIIFFAHSESTKCEIERAFSLLENAEIFMEKANSQRIEFTTLYQFCKNTVKINETQLIESDASEAKQTQLLLIDEAYKKIYSDKYRTFKPLLSSELIELFDEKSTPKGVLLSMLQHEFSVQIKGRTDCTIEEYYQLQELENGLPVRTKRDKEFIFLIFQEYQKMLSTISVFDTDDIAIQALSYWNAPFWRRERNEKGYDYIFVDEMHLFNINEQHAFHYLTKDITQKDIPICFALDYSQAIGDRGDVNSDYIEKAYGTVDKNNYQTVFRCSQQITEFCDAISAAGALMFQGSYRNPYKVPQSGFTHLQEAKCETPKLYMYRNDDEMIASIKNHIEALKRDLHCNYSELAVITFDEKMLYEESIPRLESITEKKFYVLRGRNNLCNDSKCKPDDNDVVLSDPYNVNGLEFQGVILVGIDDGRVPQNTGVSDISQNYIRYIAFNQLYLTSSRAKYRLILLGNSLHGDSICLKYALENDKIKREQK